MIITRSSNIYAVAIFLFIAVVIYGCFPAIDQMKKNGRFAIGTVHPVKDGTLRVTFMYKGIEQQRDYGKMDRFGRQFIGKRIFIQFDPNSDAFGLAVDSYVPDSILVTPYEGWSKEWMQKHFPKVVSIFDFPDVGSNYGKKNSK